MPFTKKAHFKLSSLRISLCNHFWPSQSKRREKKRPLNIGEDFFSIFTRKFVSAVEWIPGLPSTVA